MQKMLIALITLIAYLPKINLEFLIKSLKRFSMIQDYSKVRHFSKLDSYNFPKITIVVPLYNEERFVEACLESIQRQVYQNFECLIINDKSTDSSPEIVKNWIKQDKRFRLIHHDVNRGLSAARNTGIQNAMSDYITFLDSDDLLLPHSLWYRMSTLLNHASDETIIGSYSNLKLVPENAQLDDYIKFENWFSEGDYIDFFTVIGECPFSAHAPLLKLSRLKAFGGFNENMRKGAEDWDMWRRILRHGYRFSSCNTYGGLYRQKQGSMIRNMPADHLNEAVRLIASVHQLLPKSEIVADVPYVYEQPYAYYIESLQRTERIIAFALKVYLTGNEQHADQILYMIKSDDIYFINMYIDIKQIIENTIKRFFGIFDDPSIVQEHFPVLNEFVMQNLQRKLVEETI